MRKVGLSVLLGFIIMAVLASCEETEMGNRSSDSAESRATSVVDTEKSITDAECSILHNNGSADDCSSQAIFTVLPPVVNEKTIIGWWTEEPGIPAGNPAGFRFYEGGMYEFSLAETDIDTADTRNSEKGFWSIHDNQIDLIVVKKNLAILDRHETRTIYLTDIYYSDEHNRMDGKYLSFRINDIQYWKLSCLPCGQTAEDTTVIVSPITFDYSDLMS